MTAIELAREVQTEVGTSFTDAELEGIIWGGTGFPHFFAPKDDETHLDCFRRQLKDAMTGDDPFGDKALEKAVAKRKARSDWP